MTLNDLNQFLIQWGRWNNAYLESLDCSKPNFFREYLPPAYEDDYMDAPQDNYAESEFERANTRLKFVDPENRAIIKAIYLDGAESYIDRVYGEDGINRALRAFLSEFEQECAA